MKSDNNVMKWPAQKGKFIAFEGIDGSGKSTQTKYLAEKLHEINIPCYVTGEPTDSPIGSLIHQIMTGRIKTDNQVIAPLFVADRMDHLLNDTNGMLHKINAGISVIADRYYFSSYAYHSIDVPMDWVIKANDICKQVIKPTLTVFVDVPPELAVERIARNRFYHELFEEKSRLKKVREAYLEAFRRMENDENYIIIDGDAAPEKIAETIWWETKKYFE